MDKVLGDSIEHFLSFVRLKDLMSECLNGLPKQKFHLKLICSLRNLPLLFL